MARPFRASASRRIESNGSGEFNGTSTIRKPALTRISPTSSASAGRRPRRMATRGRVAQGILPASVQRIRQAHGTSFPSWAIDHRPAAEAASPSWVVTWVKPVWLRARLYRLLSVPSPIMPTGGNAVAVDFGAHFGADQQAGQIGRQAFRRNIAKQGLGANREDQGQEGFVIHGAVDAQQEGRFVIDIAGHQGAEDRMRFQDREHFTGHVAVEGGDDTVFDLCPL